MGGTRDRTLSTTPETSPPTPRTSKPGQRVSHGLVALSSAVVMAVYSAGYLRTQDAADRFESEAGQRRPAVPVPAPATAPVAAAAAVGIPEATPPAVDPQPVAPVAEAPARPPAEVAAKATAAVASPATIPDPLAEPKPSATATASATSAKPVTAPAAPVPVASETASTGPEPTPAIASSSTTVAMAPAPAPAAPTTPAAPAAPHYKDGTYTGWGTSRHGDIEAKVVIVNGRITSATIAQCWTRWPCSWIEALPGQVVARQSPETDFVSGATQSTNAFYYAVVQALGKAALP
jgi:uncharacterized protein with FMN-binding domain